MKLVHKLLHCAAMQHCLTSCTAMRGKNHWVCAVERVEQLLLGYLFQANELK